MQTGAWLVILFGLGWSGITLTFDGFLGHLVWQRMQATHFPTTDGRVTRSEVVRAKGSKGGSTYRPKITYRYKVNGEEFTGDRYHFGEISTSDSRWADGIVKAHRVGTNVTVRYDPSDPTQAVLSAGLEGDELFLGLFLSPFNCIMLIIWSLPVAWLRRRLSPEAGGVRLVTEQLRIRACMANLTPLQAGLAAAGGVGSGLVLLIGFATGFNPSLRLGLGSWGALVGAGIVAFGWRWWRIRSGIEDLTIDTGAQLLSLPRHGRRQRPAAVTFHEVARIDVIPLARAGSKGGPRYTYAPTLHLRDGRSEQLANWHDESKANAFVAWLREKLGINGPASESMFKTSDRRG